MMNITKRFKFHIGSLAILFMSGVSACAYEPHYDGPPPHVHHHHYHPYEYYYYPSVRIYFHYSTGYYYYPKGSIWIRAKKLPRGFYLDHRERVITRVDKGYPYLKHHQHRERYRPNPKYRADPVIDRKERERNLKWHEQYRHKQDKNKKHRY